jgi:hypothetical protein
MTKERTPRELEVQKQIDQLIPKMTQLIAIGSIEKEWEAVIQSISDIRYEEGERAWKERRSTEDPNIDFKEMTTLANKLGWRTSSLQC